MELAVDDIVENVSQAELLAEYYRLLSIMASILSKGESNEKTNYSEPDSAFCRASVRG